MESATKYGTDRGGGISMLIIQVIQVNERKKKTLLGPEVLSKLIS